MAFTDLFTGNNKSLDNDINATQGLASFLTSTGTKDLAKASDTYQGLLSGDSETAGKLLAPQISAMKARQNQQVQQLGQFGGRSGGTTAAVYKSSDDLHSAINSMIASLTGTALTGLTGIGEAATGQGASVLNQNAAMSQERLNNLKNSLFGQMTSGAILGGEAIGLGAAGKAAGLHSFFSS